MKIRSTEEPHKFTERLNKILGIYSLQGLTIDSDYNFSAGVEAVEFETNETIDVKSIFRKDEWLAKLCLCNSLSVPLYTITHVSGSNVISVYEISLYQRQNGPGIQALLRRKLKPKQFAEWWGKLKGTKQTKPLYEAKSRVSYFDEVLERYGLAWGGNIDGFLISSEMRPQAIIETRYTKKNILEEYDPAIFYPPHYKRAGDYKTWEPVVLLASRLKVPLFLFTFERKSGEERIGFAVIDYISEKELKYQDDPPNKNIIEGIENIKSQIKKNLSRKPPKRF